MSSYADDDLKAFERLFKRFFREGDVEMKLPQIQIMTTDIQMDLQIQEPKQVIKQPQADLQIEQPAAILEINTTRGVLKIDSSQARREIGMIGTFESVKKYAEKGKQKNLQGIARRAREGRQVMLSSGKGQKPPAYAQIARQTHGPHRTPFNIKFVPSPGSVKIDYTPGTLDVNFQRRDPKIDVKVNKPIHQYTPGDVSVTMVQRPNVEIDVIG